MSIHLTEYVELIILLATSVICILNAAGKFPLWPGVLLLTILLAAHVQH